MCPFVTKDHVCRIAGFFVWIMIENRQSGAEMTLNDVRRVFITGMNGSGTTMLADCLNNHPLIYIPRPEIKTIPYYYFTISKYGDLRNEHNFRKLLKDFSGNPGFIVSNNNAPLKIPFNFDSLKEKTLSTVIDLTFSFLASKVNKPVWGDHSPKYAAFIPVLIDLFPKAKIIHIIRDGRDNAQSFNRRFGQNIYRTVFQWKNLVQKARVDGFAAGSERYFEIKYEDLTNSPDYYMKKICAFLDVPFDSNVLNSSMPMYEKENTGRQKGFIVPNSGKWRERLTDTQIKKLEDIAGETLVSLGYPIMFNAGNKDIGAVKLFFLKWLDRIHSFAYLISKRKYLLYSNVGTLIKILNKSHKQNKYYKY